MSHLLSRFENYLSSNDLVLTPQRLLVFNVLLAQGGRVTPEQLFEGAQKLDGKISRPTVYRTIKLLHRAGLARLVYSGSGPNYYELMAHHSCLMVCESCGEESYVMNPYLDCLIQETAREQGMTVNQCHITVRGLCHKCSQGERHGDDCELCVKGGEGVD